jgi:hypothetical protein
MSSCEDELPAVEIPRKKEFFGMAKKWHFISIED